jgi:hypothetical protein
MKLLSLDEFLYNLSWSDNVRHKLRVTSDRDDLRYLVAWDNAGKMSCSAFTEKPNDWPDNTIAIWSKRGDDPRPSAGGQAISKTMQAVALVLDEGMTVYAAAKQVGVNDSAVHRALKRREGKPICECCGQVIRGQFDAPASA